MYRNFDNGAQKRSLSLSPTDVVTVLPAEMTSPSGYTLLFRTENRLFQVWRCSLIPVVKVEDEVDLTAENAPETEEVKKFAKTKTGRRAATREKS